MFCDGNLPKDFILFCFCSKALTLKIHPLYLLIPCAVACSQSYLTPIGSMPYAAVLNFARIKARDMVKHELSLKIFNDIPMFLQLADTMWHIPYNIFNSFISSSLPSLGKSVLSSGVSGNAVRRHWGTS